MLRIQLEATVSNTSTLVGLREFAAEKRESSRKQSKIDSILVDLVLQVIAKREISQNIVVLNFYHFLKHECVVFLFVFVPLT